MLIKKIVVGIVLSLPFFFIYLSGCTTNQTKPIPVASEKYSQSLKNDLLNLETKIEDKTIWIYLTNKSPNEFIPSEQVSGSIICTTELISEDNKSVGVYKEYFKGPQVDMLPHVLQIAPNATEKFGYDLTIPHGIVRVKLIYETSSAPGKTDGAKFPITEKELKF